MPYSTICQTIRGEVSDKALEKFDVWAIRIRYHDAENYIASHVFYHNAQFRPAEIENALVVGSRLEDAEDML